MPKANAMTKAARLMLLQKLYEQPGQSLRTCDIVEKLGVSDDTVKSYIDELNATNGLPLTKKGQYWVLMEDGRISQLKVRLNIHEASALYIAGRLLAQIHDERNLSVITALSKLVDALPEPLREHQHMMIDMAEQRQMNQPDRSAIFSVLTLGWAQRRKVRLLYVPPRKRRLECLFSPYLLEPSGIGRTIYALGHCDPPGELRTFKLERIEAAKLTDETFAIDPSFNGPELLTRAWGVMYGNDKPIQVHLRFSHRVSKRVKETLWHPSQTLADTPDGCEMRIQIGDTVEIENWIRGWGSDCEVLAPQSLREQILYDARRTVRKYEASTQASQNNDADDLFSSYFGGQA